MARRNVLTRIAIATVLGHVAGSYGLELLEALANYGEFVTWPQRLAAPLYDLPALISASETNLLHHGNYDALPLY